MTDEKQNPSGQQSSQQQAGQSQDRKPMGGEKRSDDSFEKQHAGQYSTNQKQDDQEQGQQKDQPGTQSGSRNRDENQGQADETGNRKAS
jgi:hypothetical protein